MRMDIAETKVATIVHSPAVRRIGRGRDEPEPLPRMETTMVGEWVCRGGGYLLGLSTRSLRRNARPRVTARGGRLGVRSGMTATGQVRPSSGTRGSVRRYTRRERPPPNAAKSCAGAGRMSPGHGECGEESTTFLSPPSRGRIASTPAEGAVGRIAHRHDHSGREFRCVHYMNRACIHSHSTTSVRSRGP